VCVVQLDPPSVEYSAVTYAVDPELFCRESVEVAEPAEQLPSDCESVRDIADMQVTVTAVAVIYQPEDGFEVPDRTLK
jgi:hypothetical protein